MTAFVLKVIACISMFIDHVAYALTAPGSWIYEVGRNAGRIAAPIFWFLIVEGYFHTRNLKKYFLRLGVFALISELPFDLLTATRNTSGNYFAHQNTMITLLIGLAAVAILDYIRKKYLAQPWIYNTLGVIVIVSFCMLAEFVKCDYSSLGVLCILVFYFFRGNKLYTAIGFFAWILIYVSFQSKREIYAVLALIPILLYNGERGKRVRYFMYVFYPVHMLVIALLSYAGLQIL